MPVKFLGISASILIGLTPFISTSAYAGFEWIPPQNNTQTPKADFAESATYNSMSGDMKDVRASSTMAIPAAPVMSEPLGMPEFNTVPAPQTMTPPAPTMPMNGGPSRGLIIDPYPMSKSDLNPQYKRLVSGASVHKGMNEEAKIAHPLKLGRNMSTMTQPVRVASTSPKVDRPFNPNASITPLPNGMVAPQMPVVEYADAVGFGRDLPLALAMSQVVPADYAFSFADDNAAGEIVSWQGGKPWDQVLSDMLVDQGLRAIIQGKKVSITTL